MSSMAAALLLLVVIVIAAAAPAYAKDYTVGDSTGWTSGTAYTTWLNGKTFNVGDTILFSYSMLHSVNEVSQSDYNSCTAANAVQSYTDGSTKINLTAPGTRYFVCGTPGHCSGGMKLAVTVGSGTSSSTGNSAPAPNSPLTPVTPTVNPTTPDTSSANIAVACDGVIVGVSALVGLALIMG